MARKVVITARPLAGAILMAALFAGCGSGGGAAAPQPPTTTTAQRPANLPPGWKRRIDVRSGYSIGVPPGWRAEEHGTTTLIRSPDHLIALSITADRTGDALAVPAGQFATQVLAALSGYRPSLDPSPPRPYGGTPLQAFSSDAVGTRTANGAKQRVTVVVLRRDDYVNYTVLVASDASRTPASERAQALGMVRSLRDYPIGTPPGSGNGVRQERG